MKWPILAVVLLAGCAGFPQVDGGVTTVTNTVALPVGVACLTPEAIPALPRRARVDPVRATTDQLAAAAAADLEAYEAYAVTADRLLQQCYRSTVTGEPHVQIRPLPAPAPIRSR